MAVVTAGFAIAAVSTASSASSDAPTALAAICVAVIVSFTNFAPVIVASVIFVAVTAPSANFAVVTAKACIAAVATWFVPNVPTFAAGIEAASINETPDSIKSFKTVVVLGANSDGLIITEFPAAIAPISGVKDNWKG